MVHGNMNYMKKNEPLPVKVSVVMSVYNTPYDLVERALDSVLNQDMPHFELIILNDGSSEELSEKLVTYAQKDKQKIKYESHSNLGQAESVNSGIVLCQGDYVAMLDSDDEYKSNHLSSCLKAIGEDDLICSLTETIVDSEEDYFVPDKDDNKVNVHVDDCVLFATFFGRINVFKKLNFKSMYAADADFYKKAAQFFKVKKVDLRTYKYYRNRKSSVSAQLKLKCG